MGTVTAQGKGSRLDRASLLVLVFAILFLAYHISREIQKTVHRMQSRCGCARSGDDGKEDILIKTCSNSCIDRDACIDRCIYGGYFRVSPVCFQPSQKNCSVCTGLDATILCPNPGSVRSFHEGMAVHQADQFGYFCPDILRSWPAGFFPQAR